LRCERREGLVEVEAHVCGRSAKLGHHLAAVGDEHDLARGDLAEVLARLSSHRK
jgi:hypothetical protein